MSTTIERLQNQRWTEFHYFADGGTDGFESISVYEQKPFRLTEIRIHFSVAFGEVEYLTARVSSAKGSAFNHTFLSYPLSDVSDYIVIYESNGLRFLSDDQIVINASMTSAANVYGLEVLGWAAYG